MREVVYKNLTSVEHKKKDILLKEVFEKDGVTAKTERRCFYYIKEIRHMETEKDFKEWLDIRNGPADASNRRFHIMKEHNDGHGEDKLICKIAGIFYAVADKCIYTIAFLHSFKVTFVKTHLA